MMYFSVKKSIATEMVELILPGLFNAFFGPAFWQCSASLAQSAHCCNFMPCLLANSELALVCSLSQNQQTLCSISNTCDIFRFKVLYKFVDDSSKKVSVVFNTDIGLKSVTDTDSDTEI